MTGGVIVTCTCVCVDEQCIAHATDRAVPQYLVPSSDGGVVFGGTCVLSADLFFDPLLRRKLQTGMRDKVLGRGDDLTDDAVVDVKLSEMLRDELLRVLRLEPDELHVTHEWTGIMGFTHDECPFVGALPRAGRYVVGGFTGHGMPQAFLAARGVASLIAGVHADIPAEWSPSRKTKK